jgi:hypothetical protein
MGHRAELPAGIVASATRRAWQLTHPDAPRLVARGMSVSLADAKRDALAAAPAYALELADALELRAAALVSRAASIRSAVLA